MKRNTLTSLFLAVIVIMMGACNNSVWDELPSPIVSFVCEYFPFGEVNSYTVCKSGSTVNIKNGATLKFDNDYEWTDVNGNGEVLPQNFLYDKLPPVVYEYIEAIEHVNEVYRVSRDSKVMKVDFHDSIIEYDESTGTITYPAATSTGELLF